MSMDRLRSPRRFARLLSLAYIAAVLTASDSVPATPSTLPKQFLNHNSAQCGRAGVKNLRISRRRVGQLKSGETWLPMRPVARALLSPYKMKRRSNNSSQQRRSGQG